MDGFFNTVKKGLADLLFPPFCISCATDGDWWCGRCRKRTVNIKEKICPACLQVGEHECGGTLPFGTVRALGYYHDPMVRKVVTALKFSGVTALQKDMCRWIADTPLNTVSPNVVLMPIPLSHERMCERAFNQAEVIARAFKEVWRLPHPIRTEGLIRKRHTEAQSSLSHKGSARKKNIHNAFHCVKKPDPHIILIDDVLTTGATAAEAAQTLLNHGARSVDIWTLALGK